MSDKLPLQFYTTIDGFTLESGEVLVNATVAFTVKGRLNARGTNAVLICHALSGSAEVEDWWSLLLSRPKNAVLDPDRFCIICCNVLGSPYGSSSPLSLKPDGSSYYGNNFPRTTIRDDVRIQKHVMDVLGVRSIYCLIGGSMGGMLALEWAIYGKQFIRSMVLIATAARQSPWAIAWAENQRATIKGDAKFREGCYGDDPPLAGLGAARMAAMLSYRTHVSFEQRFGRRRVDLQALSAKSEGARQSLMTEFKSDTGHRDKFGLFLAQSYLRYQADKFNARFDANCYLHLLDKIDSHDIARGRCSGLSDEAAVAEILGQIHQPTLVVGIPTDGLYPLVEQQALFESMGNATFAVMRSSDGHDGFLLEGEQLNDLLLSFFGGFTDLEEQRSSWGETQVNMMTPLSTQVNI